MHASIRAYRHVYTNRSIHPSIDMSIHKPNAYIHTYIHTYIHNWKSLAKLLGPSKQKAKQIFQLQVLG